MCVAHRELSVTLQGNAPCSMRGEYLGCGILRRLALPWSFVTITFLGASFVCRISRPCFGSTTRRRETFMGFTLPINLKIFCLALHAPSSSKEHLDPSLFLLWSLSLFLIFSSLQVNQLDHPLSARQMAIEMLTALPTFSSKQVNEATLFPDGTRHPPIYRYL